MPLSQCAIHLQVFSWQTTCPLARKSIMKVPNHQVARWPCFSSSDGLVQNCVTLSQWFLHKPAAYHTEQCTSPSLFHYFEVTRGGSKWSLKSYGFISDAIFKNCMHAHKSLSNETIIIQDRWIRNMVACMKTGRESLWHPLLNLCLKRACMVNDSSANTAYIYWGSRCGQTCCFVVDGKFQLKHAPASKRSDINKTQKHRNVARCRDIKSAKSRETR